MNDCYFPRFGCVREGIKQWTVSVDVLMPGITEHNSPEFLIFFHIDTVFPV